MPKIADDPDYIHMSKRYPFRLWTMKEVCAILRIKHRNTWYRLRKESVNGVPLLQPMHRRVGYEGGTCFFTDRQVFDALRFLFPDVAAIEVDYLATQITEVLDDQIFKERKKRTSKKKITKRSARPYKPRITDDER